MNDFILNKNKIYEYSTKSNVEIYFSTIHDGLSFGNRLNLSSTVGDEFSNVISNRNTYALKIGKKLDQFIYLNQTHSTNCIEIFKNDTKKFKNDSSFMINDCDGCYTFEPDVVLNTFHADCTPIYFFDTTSSLIGVIHAGWQGTLDQITYKTLNKIIIEHKIDPTNINIIIGPSISFESFNVKTDIFNKFKSSGLLNSTNFKQIDDENYKIDIKKINYEQCTKLGITNINVSSIDTFNDENLFSYRKNNVTGRMCATICRKN